MLVIGGVYWSRLGKAKESSSWIRRCQFLSFFFILFLGSGFVNRILAQSSVTTYFAGCLESNRGVLYEVSFGNTPPPVPICKPGDTAVDWSNGDILSILVGDGLMGGGLSGDTSLSILPAFRLPQSCTNGQIGKWNIFTGLWECAEDNNTFYTAGSGLNLIDNQFSLAVNGVTTTNILDNAVTAAKINNVTRGITANLMGLHAEPGVGFYGGFGVRMMNSGFSDALYTFMIPYDYAGGDLLVREWYRPHDSSGTAKLFRWYNKLSANGQETGIESHVPFDYICCNSARSWVVPEAVVSPGDIFWVELERQGDLSDDTMGRLDLKAVAVEYLAEQ